MYFPLLRGKQFELKALREFSSSYPNNAHVTPIIEPVNESIGSLVQGMNEMLQNGLRFAIILNPELGDFKHENVSFKLLQDNPDLLNQLDRWIPAYIVKRNVVQIKQLIEESPFSKGVMLVVKSAIDLEDASMMELINDNRIGYVVHDFGNSSRRVRSHIIGAGKRIIEVEDCFVSKKRNADYSDPDDESFSETPFYYEEDGFYGFSDYTALPSEYVEGGMLPYAIAIHLTYQKSRDQIFIHHFVSDTNWSQSDPKKKFKEAATKVAIFFADKPHTSAVEDLMERVNDGDGYPGLGYLKKLSISNHLELMNRILSGED